MSKLHSIGQLIAKIGAWLSAVMLGTMVVLMVTEMIARGVFSSSIYIVEDVVGYGTAAILFLSLAYTFVTGGHIRVNILLDSVPPKIRYLFEIICTLAGGFAISYLTWFISAKVLRNFIRNVTSTGMYKIPLWIPGLIIAVGLVMLLVVLAIHLVSLLAGSGGILRSDLEIQGE